jgi:hypothetical protein
MYNQENPMNSKNSSRRSSKSPINSSDSRKRAKKEDAAAINFITGNEVLIRDLASKVFNDLTWTEKEIKYGTSKLMLERCKRYFTNSSKGFGNFNHPKLITCFLVPEISYAQPSSEDKQFIIQ